jgi:hypothetical protein
MATGCRIAVLLLSALVLGGAARAQPGDAPPPASSALEPPRPGDFLPRLPGEPSLDTPNLDAFPVPDDKPPGSPADAPPAPPHTGAARGGSVPPGADDAAGRDAEMTRRNRLAVRAKYDASMQTVDSGFAELLPFVRRTVLGLKRLALGRIASDQSAAERQHRQLLAGQRRLAAAERRLRMVDDILDRWRMAQPTSPQEQAAMLAGVYRRAGDADIVRRQIACGRYFAAATDVAIRRGATRGTARIPPGC